MAVQNFREWAWEWVPAWMRRTPDGETRRQIHLLADGLADIKNSLLAARRLWFPGGASPELLEVLGEGRNMPRYPNETIDAYRRRVARAFEIHQAGGTRDGIVAALEAAGFVGADAVPCYLLGGTFVLDGTYLLNGAQVLDGGVRPAEFDVRLPHTDTARTVDAWDLLRRVVRKTKAASSRLRQIVVTVELGAADLAPAPEDEPMGVTASTWAVLNGAHDLDGSWALGPLSSTVEVV